MVTAVKTGAKRTASVQDSGWNDDDRIVRIDTSLVRRTSDV